MSSSSVAATTTKHKSTLELTCGTALLLMPETNGKTHQSGGKRKKERLPLSSARSRRRSRSRRLGLGWRTQSPADGVVRTSLTSEASCARHEIRIKAVKDLLGTTASSEIIFMAVSGKVHAGLAQQKSSESRACLPGRTGPRTCSEAQAATAESSTPPPSWLTNSTKPLHSLFSVRPPSHCSAGPAPGEREEATDLSHHHSGALFRPACPTLPRRAQAKQ
jgi:hypothetical protein